VLIKPPSARVGPLTPQERQVLLTTDQVGTKYDRLVNRQSAEEMLDAKRAEAAAATAMVQAKTQADKQAAKQAKADAVAKGEQLRLQREQERLEAQVQRQ
jgi:hypothetical protein